MKQNSTRTRNLSKSGRQNFFAIAADFIRSSRCTGISSALVAGCQPSVAKADLFMSRKLKRIGIFAGTFNPIHSGHISLALQALEASGLDKIYFMPERRPRHKTNVEHYGHRVAMIRSALLPHPRLDVLETDDISFTVNRTLSRLNILFAGSELVFLVGSDVAPHILDWPGGSKLLAEHELIIGQRVDTLKSPLIDTPNPRRLLVLEHPAPEISSHEVRKGLRERRYVRGLLSSVAHYSNRNWLYVSVG